MFAMFIELTDIEPTGWPAGDNASWVALILTPEHTDTDADTRLLATNPMASDETK